MTDPTILFVKPQSISDEDRAALREAGVIVVEIDDPASAKFVRAGYEIDSSSMLAAAMKAMLDTKGGEYSCELQKRFALNIARAIIGDADT
jgi:hypothetical protein